MAESGNDPPGRTDSRWLDAIFTPASSMELAVGFIDCINRGDASGLGQLMSEDHELRVFDEPPLRGRADNIEAWRGYLDSFPNYRIYSQQVAERGERVAILGSTTGSHLGLQDEDERQLTLIWVAEVRDGTVRSWSLITDCSENRGRFGLA